MAALRRTLPLISFIIPLKTKSQNQQLRGASRGMMFAKARQAKLERTAASMVTPPYAGPPLITVHLVRVSKGVMDDDAVPAALKHVRDGIADKLRIDDGSPLIRFTYSQEKGEPAVRVQITTGG